MSRTPETNVKAILLTTTDNIIDDINQKLAKLYNQDEPYSKDEEKEFIFLQDELFAFVKFRKAFSAEIDYDFKILKRVVEKIIAIQA